METKEYRAHDLRAVWLLACRCRSFAVASRLAVDQTMVPEPNLVVPDRLPLSGSVVEMAEHAFKEACLGEFMAAVQVREWLHIPGGVHMGLSHHLSYSSLCCVSSL